MAFSSRPNSQFERLNVAILTLTLSILIALPANQLRAATTYDAGFNAVSGQIWARNGGASESLRDSDDSLPEASVAQSADLGQILIDTTGSAGKHGLKAKNVTTRKPAPFGNNASGASRVFVRFTDTIIVSPSECAPVYGIDKLSFNCLPSDSDIEVPVTPNLSVNHVINPQIGTANYTPVISAICNLLIQVAYGSESAQANFHRCATSVEAGGGQVPCDGNPDGEELSGFSNGDTDPDPAVFSGQLNGNGAPLTVLVSAGSSTGDFSLTMTLTASGNVGGQSDISAVADVHTNETISYAKTGPVFNLPEGWTAWSTSGAVRDNRWVEPSLFDDGFEALQ
jgi:hypothetical protein